jgi:hypothetical protein
MILEKIVVLKLNGNRHIPTLPKNMQEDKIMPLQSEFKPKGRDLIRGLSPQLERILLPSLIGVQPQDVSWSTKTREYWADFSITPTVEGLQLNIATTTTKYKDAEGKEHELETPVQLEDYCIWQMAIQSSRVASTPLQMEQLSLYDFILIDLEEAKAKERDAFAIIEKADLAYSKLISTMEVNQDKAKWVVDLMRERDVAFDVDNATPMDLKMALRKLKDDKPEAFVKEVESPVLELKAFVMKCLEFGLLTKQGNDFYFGDENLGDFKATVLGFKEAKNSGKKMQLESKIQAMRESIRTVIV